MAVFTARPRLRTFAAVAYESIFRITGRAVVVAVAMLASIAVLLLGLEVLGGSGHPGAFGRELFVVTSGSMSPSIDAGDLVVVDARTGSSSSGRPGDVITFRRRSDPPLFVTHRVVSATRATDGSAEFVTKGDSNPVPDGARVHLSDVVGKVEFVVPFAGMVIAGLGNRRAVLAVALAGLLAELALLIHPVRPEVAVGQGALPRRRQSLTQQEMSLTQQEMRRKQQ